MLDDKQIDELERLIVFSELKDLPMILSRAVPLLFSELRLVKATLDSKVSNFLGGLDAVSHATQRDSGASQGSVSRGVEHPSGVVGDRGHGADGVHPPHGQRPNQDGPQANAGAGDRPRRGRPKGSRNKSKLESGGREEEMGGGQPGQSVGTGEGGIEANARLTELQRAFNEQGGVA